MVKLESMTKVIQDRSKCIGCLACVGLAPELFEADSNTGLAKLKDATQEGEIFQREVDDANPVLADACCGGAISLE